MKATTQARIDRVMAVAGFPTSIDQPLRDAVEAALREQDRDTRHACAEAVLDAGMDGYKGYHMVVVTIQNAQRACMNAPAI